MYKFLVHGPVGAIVQKPTVLRLRIAEALDNNTICVMNQKYVKDHANIGTKICYESVPIALAGTQR